MGQQQLLLLVLGIVIVGLAVVVGIQAFSENQTRSNLDALVADGTRIASDVQVWSMKPPTFGGPAEGEDWAAATFQDLGYPPPTDPSGLCVPGMYQSTNGCFMIQGGVVLGAGFAGGVLNDNRIRVDVTGRTPGDIRSKTTTDGTIPDAP